jgi:hypothetical protein
MKAKKNVLRAIMIFVAVCIIGILPITVTANEAVKTFEELQAALDDATVTEIIINEHIITTESIEISRTVTFSGDGVLDADGGRFTVIVVESDGHLILEDNLTITGSNESGVHVVDGEFTMNGGTISDNSADNRGGGVLVGGKFTMNGGNITNNAANGFNSNGGGVSG